MKPPKIIIGLTGNFGTGKSTVARMFGALGAGVIDADRLVHEALRPTSEIYPRIARLFRNAKAVRKKEIDRKKIAQIVFRDAGKRRKLEALIHPYVFSRMISEIAEARERVVVLEVPLLFETGFDQFCSATVMVHSPEAVAVRRLARRGISRGETRGRWRAQMGQEEKISRAAVVIDNSHSIEKTRREVRKVWKKISSAKKGERSTW